MAEVAEALMARRTLAAADLRGLVPCEVTALGLRILDETRNGADPVCPG